METFITIYLVNLAAAAALMVGGWIYSLIKKNVTIADSLWGLGFILIAWLTFFRADGVFARQLLIAAMVTLWGVRLFIHLSTRNRGKGEDPRYAQWRQQHGENFWIISLFKVFLVQALFQWIIALGVQYGQSAAAPLHLTWLDFLGMGIWLAGMIIEATADAQLKTFLQNPANRGRIMDKGLWRYSRHPNYFGESLIWWGIFVLVLSTPWGIWTIISPMLITYTLLRLTGVTLMEETQFVDNPDYRAYIRKTSPFIPWLRKKP
jgi:steroid 5-alpha reductase family enzyme